MDQPKLPFHGAVLSREHGGTATCRGYCRFWTKRPARLDERLLCSGGEWWRPCPDYAICYCNPAPEPERGADPSKPRPDYSLRLRGRAGVPDEVEPDDAD